MALSVDAIGPHTSGAAVAITGVTGASSATAGTVGEIIDSVVTTTFTQSSPVAGTWYDATSGSISLTAGDWLITAFGFLTHSQTASSSNLAFPQLAIRDGSNTNLAVTAGGCITANGTVTLDGSFTPIFLGYHANISGTTTYKLSIRYVNFNGTPTVGGINLRGDTGTNYALNYFIRGVRIR